MAAQTAEIMNIILPGSGNATEVKLASGAQVNFDFDLSEAVFSAQGGDLVITVQGGGTIVLEGYLPLAEEGGLSGFETQDGEQLPGDFYLFAFGEGASRAEESLETAAEGQAGGSGAGDYEDSFGQLGDGVEALGGQGDAYDSVVADVPESLTGEAVPAGGEIVYPEDEEVQIVLNSSYEAGNLDRGSWRYTQDVEHWKNTGEDSNNMETWSTRMHQKPQDGERHMELDSVRHSVDELSQTIATQEGEEITLSFNFAPRVGHHLGMGTNDFSVSLGEQEIATITWQGDYRGTDGAWVVTLGEGVTLPEDSPYTLNEDGTFTFENYGREGKETVWSELSFTVEAAEDHAQLTFVEEGRDDSYGTLIDNVTAYRPFHQLIQGSEGSDHLVGSEGDDAIFSTSREVIDGTDPDFSAGDFFIYGGGGDDAIYMAGGEGPVAGGSGNDFIVSGDGSHRIATGTGNDHIVLGEGNDRIYIDQSIMTDGAHVTIEDFTAGGSGGDRIMIGIGASLGDVLQDGDDMLLTIEADNGAEVTIELLGVSQANTSSYVVEGYTSTEVLSDAIQSLIDSGISIT